MKKNFITIISLACLLCCIVVLCACNGKRKPPETPAHTHNYLWVDNGDGTHKQHCSVNGCNAPDINSGNHVWNTDNKCDNCKAVNPDENPPEHVHAWSNIWEQNDAHHWHNCSADGCTITENSQKNGYAEHDFTDGNCICGKAKPVIPTAGLEYVLNSNGESYAVKGIGTATDTEIVILPEYNGKPVTSIRGSAFQDCSSVTGISIPDSVTSINIMAFYGCSSLQNIVIPDSVAAIGDLAFYNCGSLANVTLGNTVTTIGGKAFYGCGSLQNIVIPDGVTFIGNLAFCDCSSLRSVTIGNGISFLNNDTFANCPIETAAVPAVVCPHIKNPALKTVMITSGSIIDDEALKGCTELTSLTIGNTVTAIGKKAFYGCGSVTEISIPYSVDHIGDYAFYGCNSLTGISVDGNNAGYASRDGILYNKAETQFIHIPKAVSGKVTISDGITFIGGDTFSGCRSLTEIIIPNTVSSIGWGAFYNCTGLTEITIPDTVTLFAEDAFANCKNLASIRFNGTAEQWNAITKGDNWNYDTGNYTVHCSDGNITK